MATSVSIMTILVSITAMTTFAFIRAILDLLTTLASITLVTKPWPYLNFSFFKNFWWEWDSEQRHGHLLRKVVAMPVAPNTFVFSFSFTSSKVSHFSRTSDVLGGLREHRPPAARGGCQHGQYGQHGQYPATVGGINRRPSTESRWNWMELGAATGAITPAWEILWEIWEQPSNPYIFVCNGLMSLLGKARFRPSWAVFQNLSSSFSFLSLWWWCCSAHNSTSLHLCMLHFATGCYMLHCAICYMLHGATWCYTCYMVHWIVVYTWYSTNLQNTTLFGWNHQNRIWYFYTDLMLIWNSGHV